MPAPLAFERLLSETLRRLTRYRIEVIGCRYVVIRRLRWDKDHEERVCVNRDEAEAYLFARLPHITEPRDITRTS